MTEAGRKRSVPEIYFESQDRLLRERDRVAAGRFAAQRTVSCSALRQLLRSRCSPEIATNIAGC